MFEDGVVPARVELAAVVRTVTMGIPRSVMRCRPEHSGQAVQAAAGAHQQAGGDQGPGAVHEGLSGGGLAGPGRAGGTSGSGSAPPAACRVGGRLLAGFGFVGLAGGQPGVEAEVLQGLDRLQAGQGQTPVAAFQGDVPAGAGRPGHGLAGLPAPLAVGQQEECDVVARVGWMQQAQFLGNGQGGRWPVCHHSWTLLRSWMLLRLWMLLHWRGRCQRLCWLRPPVWQLRAFPCVPPHQGQVWQPWCRPAGQAREAS